MNSLRYMTFVISFACSILSAGEFTICSYNCGGLTEHYDYLRAASMQKLMQERFDSEPENMALNEKIQQLAVKLLFASKSTRSAALQEWNQGGYQHLFEHLTAAPTAMGSPNTKWHEKSNETISNYKVRPVVIEDHEVKHMLHTHLKDLTQGKGNNEQELLQEARAKMAKRIFHHHLKYDIICLQEADYLDSSLFPERYEVLFADTSHSLNGIAWNKERFELITTIGSIRGRAFAVHLADRESGKTILVASGHLTGCNPYRVDIDPETGIEDSAKGDADLQAIIKLLDKTVADLKVIGMDSNVTALHPRLQHLKSGGYRIDAENHLEPTCTNPHQMLNTRIDWIALKAKRDMRASVVNIPVLSVGLNNMQTNMSDHKPIAAKVYYDTQQLPGNL